MHSTLTYTSFFSFSAAKLSLFCETNKYFARKIAFSLTIFHFYTTGTDPIVSFQSFILRQTKRGILRQKAVSRRQRQSMTQTCFFCLTAFTMAFATGSGSINIG